MTEHSGERDHLFIKEVRPHQAITKRAAGFFHSSAKAAAIMLAAAIVALVVANSEAYGPFVEFWHTYAGFVIGDRAATMSFAHIINDIFMAVFFLLVGLEIKYEMTVGELTNIRAAILPIIAAAGGVLAPIGIYLAFNAANPATSHGWGVPMATDIAFALGIMALLGTHVPNGIRVFLSTLAVADDIIAILVIAVFYGQSPSMGWILAALAIFAVLIVLNRSHVYSLAPYLLLGTVLWYCVFMSGIHATIAGVLLAFAIPSGSRVNLKSFISWSGDKVKQADDIYQPEVPLLGQKEYIKAVSSLSTIARQVVPPATRLEQKLYPWVYFAILPLFALTNADVRFLDGSLGDIFADPALYGVFFGLLVGKPLGIMALSWVVVKLKVASLPENVNWMHMMGAGILGGVGFTMAIFVANLAFEDPAIIATAKVGILAASALAGVTGFAFLWVQAQAARRRGISYIRVRGSEGTSLAADREMLEEGEELLAEIESPLVEREIERARAEGIATPEVIADLGEDRRFGAADGAEAEADGDGGTRTGR